MAGAAGYSGTPLPRKLGIRPGARVAVLDPPGDPAALLDPLPAGARLVIDPPLPATDREEGARAFDVVLAFVRDLGDVTDILPRARLLIAWDGGLWLSWPKASSPLATDLREGDVRREGLAAGLVDNKICAVDEDWSALRLVYRLGDRPTPPRRR